MAKLTITVCDVCRDPERKTTAYRVGKVGPLRSVDLCDEHARPIENLISNRPAPARSPRRRTMEQTITTIEEIEARKKRQQAHA